MTEAYQATGDAVGEVLSAAFGKMPATRPWYTRDPEKPEVQGLTGAALEAAIDALALQFPDQVN